ncbi:Prophage antirepressor [hydrothermal vent metagenome]|uniref:Prophage antirepressor n=1 Tax=hydrothermal vent metagenome TaxID=652676 RepID=A0A3B0ZFY7_9ZZZZ
MKTDTCAPESMALFEDYQIRRVYDEETETWWFSVIDIVQVLTQQADYQTARKYWNKLKQRLDKEGSQLVTNCHQLKMTATDGKQRVTDWDEPIRTISVRKTWV